MHKVRHHFNGFFCCINSYFMPSHVKTLLKITKIIFGILALLYYTVMGLSKITKLKNKKNSFLVRKEHSTSLLQANFKAICSNYFVDYLPLRLFVEPGYLHYLLSHLKTLHLRF